MTDNEVLLTKTELNSYMQAAGTGYFYENIGNKPTINGEELSGDKKGQDYGLVSYPKSSYEDDFSGNIFDLIYPVGSFYITVNYTNPNYYFKGTTWEQVKNTFLLATDYDVNTSNSNNTPKYPVQKDKRTSVAGSKDAVIPAHNHAIKTDNTTLGIAMGNLDTVNVSAYRDTHTHSPKNGSHFLGRDDHYMVINIDTNKKYTQQRKALNTNSAGKWYTWMSADIDGLCSSTATTIPNGGTDHRHTITGNTKSTGVSATDANMPPYFPVCVWVRTA